MLNPEGPLAILVPLGMWGVKVCWQLELELETAEAGKSLRRA